MYGESRGAMRPITKSNSVPSPLQWSRSTSSKCSCKPLVQGRYLVDKISRCLSRPSPQRAAFSVCSRKSATGSEPHLSGFAAGSLESTPPERSSRWRTGAYCETNDLETAIQLRKPSMSLSVWVRSSNADRAGWIRTGAVPSLNTKARNIDFATLIPLFRRSAMPP